MGYGDSMVRSRDTERPYFTVVGVGRDGQWPKTAVAKDGRGHDSAHERRCVLFSVAGRLF